MEMSWGLILIQLLFFLQLTFVWKCGIVNGKGECIASVYRSTKIRITVARAECGCSSHQMGHGKFQQSGSGATHPVSFIIKHCVPTWDLMHNKVGNIYNKHAQRFEYMAHSVTTVKAQKPRRKKKNNWNASSGTSSHVEDGTKQRRAQQVTEMCPVDSRGEATSSDHCCFVQTGVKQPLHTCHFGYDQVDCESASSYDRMEEIHFIR